MLRVGTAAPVFVEHYANYQFVLFNYKGIKQRARCDKENRQNDKGKIDDMLFFANALPAMGESERHRAG